MRDELLDHNEIRTLKLCSAASHLKFNVTDYIKHIKIFYAFKLDFKITCGINGCQRSYSNLGTFLNHVSDVHSDVCTRTTGTIPAEDDTVQLNEDNEDYQNNISDNDEISSTPASQDNCEDDGHFNPSQELMQRSSALFLLGLKGNLNLLKFHSKVLCKV